MPSAGGTAFAATHRMADWIHTRSAVVRPSPHPSLASGFSQTDVHVIGVADRADGGATIGADPANLTRWESNLRPSAFTGCQGGTGTGAAAKLTTTARLHLQVMYGHAQRDDLERQAVADFRFRRFAAHHLVAGFQAFGRQDISLDAVLILHQGNSR